MITTIITIIITTIITTIVIIITTTIIIIITTLIINLYKSVLFRRQDVFGLMEERYNFQLGLQKALEAS